MLRLFLDPHVLAMPQVAVASGETADVVFEKFVSLLLELADVRRQEFGQMYLPRDTEEALFAANLYPLWDGLEKALTAANLHHAYQPQDVVAVVDGFLKQLPRLEDELRITALLAQPPSLKPDGYLNNYAHQLAEIHRNLMLLVCVLQKCDESSGVGDFVIVRNIAKCAISVQVKGNIEQWELSADGPCHSLGVPLTIDHCVQLTRSWDDLLRTIDSVGFWCSATTSSERQFAFIGFLRSFGETHGFSKSMLEHLAWQFGGSFLASACALGFGHERGKVQRLLTAMAESVLKINLTQVHQLRSGKAGNDPQVRRGQDAAWRKDIDYEFHLHFWSTTAGPEFAATVVHEDYNIPG